MKNVILNMKVEKELKDILTKKAKAKGLSLSGYVRMIIIEKLNEEK